MKYVTKGLSDLHKRLRKAIIESEKMTADQFNDIVSISHGDGSYFKFENCKLKMESKFTVVYQEHGCPVVFCAEDVKIGRFKQEVRL